MKVKFAFYVQNGGDGSAIVRFFKNVANAEAYAGDEDDRFTDGDCEAVTLEFDEDGNLVTKEPVRHSYNGE